MFDKTPTLTNQEHLGFSMCQFSDLTLDINTGKKKLTRARKTNINKHYVSLCFRVKF